MQVISEDLTVQDSSGKKIKAQILPVLDTSIALRKVYATAYVGKKPPSLGPLYWLAFTAQVAPFGFNTYIITSVKGVVLQIILSLSSMFTLKSCMFEDLTISFFCCLLQVELLLQ